MHHTNEIQAHSIKQVVAYQQKNYFQTKNDILILYQIIETLKRDHNSEQRIDKQFQLHQTEKRTSKLNLHTLHFPVTPITEQNWVKQ